MNHADSIHPMTPDQYAAAYGAWQLLAPHGARSVNVQITAAPMAADTGGAPFVGPSRMDDDTTQLLREVRSLVHRPGPTGLVSVPGVGRSPVRVQTRPSIRGDMADHLRDHGLQVTTDLHSPRVLWVHHDDRLALALGDAYQLGRHAGQAAASWATDGNTSRDHARRVLQLIADGDPQLDDLLPAVPSLSGEWADDDTPRTLIDQVRHGDDLADFIDDLADQLADAWDRGVMDTFMPTIERDMARIAADDDTDDDDAPDVCPDCGNTGTTIGPDGYQPCTRYRRCWSDTDDSDQPTSPQTAAGPDVGSGDVVADAFTRWPVDVARDTDPTCPFTLVYGGATDDTPEGWCDADGDTPRGIVTYNDTAAQLDPVRVLVPGDIATRGTPAVLRWLADRFDQDDRNAGHDV